jgi:malonate transporter
MAIVIAALLPVFLLIVLGLVLKRTLMRLETQWHGLERLTYCVLLQMLLIQKLVKANLTKVPVAGVGGALLLSALLMSLLCLAIRPLLARLDVDGPAFTSVFQGATRWQTYVALAVSSNFYGDTGLALASVAMVAIIPLVNAFSVSVLAHYASPEKQSVRAIAMTVVRNPLIWACAIGLAINVLHLPLPTIWHEVADALGRSSLAIGLLVTGAGLHLEGLFRPSQGRRGRRVSQADPDARARDRACVRVRPQRRQSRDCRRLLSRARVIERLCNGPANGGRCSASGADHHAPDHFGRHMPIAIALVA